MQGDLQNTKQARHQESSFTLLEVIIALGIMVSIMLEVSSAQGNALRYSNYERKVTQAIWLAKSIMSQVEYKWNFYDIKDVKADIKDQRFDESICPKNLDCDFTYSLNIELWKLPLLDIALKNMGGGLGGFAEMAKEQIKKIVGDEILKIAHVKVFWGEGTRRENVNLSYLITAQRKLDTAIGDMQSPKAPEKKASEKKEPTKKATNNL